MKDNKIMRSFLNRLPWKKIIRFAVTGSSAFAIDFICYFLLTRFAHLPYLASRTISILVAMSWNFGLNRYWTFQAQAGRVGSQAIRFTVVMTLTSLLNLFLMRLGVSVLGLNDLFVIVVVSLLIMVVNFTAHSLWSYANISTK